MVEAIKKPINYRKLAIKVVLIFFGVLCYSFGLKCFIYQAGILPAGFTGLSSLMQKLVYKSSGVLIPITIYNLAWNIVPASFSYRLVGKKFTILSFIVLFLFNFVADSFPSINLTNDPFVASIFGGILCGFGASLWFRCGVSGGGTDFVAMSVSAKFHISTFGYIMAFNILLIMIQGMIFGWELAFYSIIYQYVSTQAINLFYRHYEARTIFIITTKPNEVASAMIEKSGHSSTQFDGIGSYTKNSKSMLYTVVTQPEVRQITNIIRKCDPEAFINVMKSNEIQGKFNYLSVEQDVIDMNY
ncbi:MAG: YitT family protein [Lachnospiraceae bacterium]|nr:YitT family protein [Lachnospiraceae bacterium]